MVNKSTKIAAAKETGALFPRYILPRLLEALKDTPVVLIHGPRQCGKTTLAQTVGQKLDYRYYTFDDLDVLAATREDPLRFVNNLTDNVILDEVQKVPELFASLKRAIDKDRRPGRLILTGSANVFFVPSLSDSLAGRMEVVPLFPLAQCEIDGTKPRFIKELFAGTIKMRQGKRAGPELYDRVLKGGYPVALLRENLLRRRRWYREYVDTLIQKDIRDLGRLSYFDAIPKLLELIAGQTSRLRNFSELSGPFEIKRQTIRRYVNLLEKLFLVDLLPPWHSNQIKRLVKTPKLHLGDTGLAAALLGKSEESLVQDRAFFGQLLESFVYNELKRQTSWAESGFVNFFHYRDKDQYEVDLVIQKGTETFGVEVKAAATVTAKDFRGMKRLRQSLGNRFKCGVVLYDGDNSLPFGDRLYAVPIKALWSNQ